jgi:hypothetical protein
VGRIAGRQAAAESAVQAAVISAAERRRAAADVGKPEALLAPRVAHRMSVLLYLGDCAVVTGVLMASNPNLPLVLAAITSLAMATAQFTLGKRLGQVLLGMSTKGRAARVQALVVVAMFGVSLAALLHHIEAAWVFLSIAPAIGAAALTLVSHDPERERLFQAGKDERRPSRVAARRIGRFSRAVGRAAATWAKLAAIGTSNLTALEQAEAAFAGVTTVDAHLTKGVHGIRTSLEDLEVLRLRGLIDQAEARLSSMLKDLASVTQAQVEASRAGDRHTIPLRNPVPSNGNGSRTRKAG